MGEREIDRAMVQLRSDCEAYSAALKPVLDKAAKDVAEGIVRWRSAPETKAAFERLRAGIANLRWPSR